LVSVGSIGGNLVRPDQKKGKKGARTGKAESGGGPGVACDDSGASVLSLWLELETAKGDGTERGGVLSSDPLRKEDGH